MEQHHPRQRTGWFGLGCTVYLLFRSVVSPVALTFPKRTSKDDEAEPDYELEPTKLIRKKSKALTRR